MAVSTGLFFDALANQRRVQCRVVRLLQGAAQRRTQQLRILLPGLYLGRHFGVAGQPGFKHTAITLRQLVIDVGV